MAKIMIGKRLIGHSRTVYRRIFPKRIEFPEKVQNILKKIYPSLDFDAIRFYEGMPWFIDQSFAHAITLPGAYNINRVHIHFAYEDHKSYSGLSTIVHECFHALQYQELYKSRGVGLFRIFTIHYLAEFFKLFFRHVWKLGIVEARQLAYDHHPMEIPAFEIDRKFQEFCSEKDRGSVFQNPVPTSFITHQTGHEYKAGRFPYWFSVILLFFLTVTAPVIEFLLLIYAGGCFVLGKGLALFSLF